MVKKAFDAIYENGVLRPLSPLSLAEGEKVRISIDELSEKALYEQLADAAKATDPLYPGPIEAYETAKQLQAFLDEVKGEVA